MSEWKTIESAPKDGSKFLAWQDGEIYIARYTTDGTPRLCWRTHANSVESKYYVIDAEFEGKPVKARLPFGEPWDEKFRHDWTLWTRGFDFNPTLWAEITAPPSDHIDAQAGGMK